MTTIYNVIKNNAWAGALGLCLSNAGYTLSMWQWWASVLIICALNVWSKSPDAQDNE